MRSLVEIGRKHGTDKCDERHSFGAVSFLDIYQRYFEGMRHLPINLLEIGVWRGASLHTWEDYFPLGHIYGLDIDPAAQFASARIKITIGDQSDPTTLRRAAGGELLDVVIDDGSHVVDHILASLEILWPRLRPGGYYVIEDLHCSRCDISASPGLWPGQARNAPETNYRNNRAKLDAVIAKRLEHMDALQGDTAFVHFWPAVVVMRKAEICL